MRIIKNPNPVKEVEKECEGCGCVFAFTDGDIKTYTYSNNIIGPGNYGYRKRYVLCPNCGKEIVLEEKSSNRRVNYSTVYTTDLDKIEPEPDIEELITMFPHLTEPEDGEE